MLVSQDQSNQLAQTQKIAPHLIQASAILQCTSIELAQTIEREVMDNPALDCVNSSTELCPGCPSRTRGCRQCPFASGSFAEQSRDGKSADTDEETFKAEAPYGESDRRGDPWLTSDVNSFYQDGVEQAFAGREAFDPFGQITAGQDIHSRLLETLIARAKCPSERRVAACLVSNLDDRGWLTISELDAMDEARVGLDQVRAGIFALQACEPAGVGARDLRECLMLQLRQLADDGRGSTVLERMLDRCWDEFVQRQFASIARKLKVSVNAVTDAVEFLKNELTADPFANYREPWENTLDSRSEAIKPDVTIRRTETRFEVEVRGDDLPAVQINQHYRALYEEMRADPAKPGARKATTTEMSSYERAHIIQSVERANIFLKNIQQRRRTIERITRCLIDSQQGFIETGSKAFLRPMTRTELAQKAKVHESTVSRALLQKFVQLPNQDVVSYDIFFSSAGSVKDTIAQLIASEDSAKPLSDEAVRAMLAEMGHDIARRTVVKYRESLRIPASYLRRTP